MPGSASCSASVQAARYCPSLNRNRTLPPSSLSQPANAALLAYTRRTLVPGAWCDRTSLVRASACHSDLIAGGPRGIAVHCRPRRSELVGVVVDGAHTRYFASQPWPFPQSLMRGFTARSSSSVRAPLRVDHNELLEAAWFDKRDVRVAAAVSVGPTANKQHAAALLANHPHARPLLPPKGTISRSLIDNWLDDVNGTEAAPRESSDTSGYFGPYLSSAKRFI